jgi:phosphohistidine phosphatase
MKTIYVVRHSKAEQDFLGSDFERKLTETGKTHSELVAKRFLEKSPSITLFISSPAKRAKTTAQIFAANLHYDKEQILYQSALYHAPSFVYYSVLENLPTDVASVILFAHNPGITDFINSLKIVQLDNMPTTGIFGFTADIENWTSFTKGKKHFLHFDSPKH